MVRPKDFPGTFWIANTMEIFERMAWYGFFAVSSLYITGAVSDGGLGFSDEDRGILQGVVTFFLYLFPVASGALADRYGFKKMLFWSFLVLTPAYFFLGQFNSFYSFFLAFMLVAIGAGMFKPVIIGTVSKTTNDKTSSMGFGIFYMMVNIGGFVGPIIAGILRAWDWNYVFMASSGWIIINIILVSIFYREPTSESKSENPRTFKKVLEDMVEVLGNGRFFLLVFVLLILLVLGSKLTAIGYISWGGIMILSILWLALNFLYYMFIKKIQGRDKMPWYLQPVKLADWKFGLYLLLMSGFWTCFNQIFYTLPLHIRDFVDTSDIMAASVSFFETIGLSSFVPVFKSAMVTPGQINPEYIINIDAGAIIIFQVVISVIVGRMQPFTTIFWGVVITIVSFVILVLGTSGWIVVAGIVVFSFGEMMASPKSKEYTGKIAPPNKVALYMGYFYWCVALGNLFGGLLSGQMYATFARDMQRPDLMWLFFALLALITAVAIFFYDRVVIKKKS